MRRLIWFVYISILCLICVVLWGFLIWQPIFRDINDTTLTAIPVIDTIRIDTVGWVYWPKEACTTDPPTDWWQPQLEYTLDTLYRLTAEERERLR